jgi:beta-lactamase superfamily II metal-dependent hydrolase
LITAGSGPQVAFRRWQVKIAESLAVRERTMNRIPTRSSVGLALSFFCLSSAGAASSATLDIYFIDVEGGQSTLLVTPRGESFLIDTGWPGIGGPEARPGDPAKSRDANRIAAAAKDAGVKQIDHLLITHFHPDHDGGAVELSRLLPIRHFIDHGSAPAEVQQDSNAGAAFRAYEALRKGRSHLEPRPGERLPMAGIEALVVSSAAETLRQPLSGAGQLNSACGKSATPAGDTFENPRSTGVVVSFGKFRFLDVGDLSGQPLFDLTCPKNMIGRVDVYLVAHHGGDDVADPATFEAFAPRVAVMNNGRTKGGAQVTYAALHQVKGLEDVWQLHRSEAAGAANFPPERIANLDESTAHWIKLSARDDGSFTVFNQRTGERKAYPASGGR